MKASSFLSPICSLSLVIFFININLLNGKLTSLEASEGLCPLEGHVPVAEHANYPWLLIGRSYYVPMASKHAMLKYAEVFLGRSPKDPHELDRMNLHVEHVLGKYLKKGFDREFRQLCLSESKKLRKFPRNLLERNCYIIRSWLNGEGTDTAPLTTSLDTIVWTDNHTAILVTKCINDKYYDWEVYSIGKKLLPHVRDQILDVVQYLGFSLHNVLYYDYDHHKFYQKHPVVVPLPGPVVGHITESVVPFKKLPPIPPPHPPPGLHLDKHIIHDGPHGHHPPPQSPLRAIKNHILNTVDRLRDHGPHPVEKLRDYGPHTYYDSHSPKHVDEHHHHHPHHPPKIHAPPIVEYGPPPAILVKDHGPPPPPPTVIVKDHHHHGHEHGHQLISTPIIHQIGPHPAPAPPGVGYVDYDSGAGGVIHHNHPPHYQHQLVLQHHHQYQPLFDGVTGTGPSGYAPLVPAYTSSVPVKRLVPSPPELLQPVEVQQHSYVPGVIIPNSNPESDISNQLIPKLENTKILAKQLQSEMQQQIYHNPVLAHAKELYPSSNTALTQYFNYPILPNLKSSEIH